MQITLIHSSHFLLPTILLILILLPCPTTPEECIDSAVGSPCLSDPDCYLYEEKHLYCNKTGGVNICAFQIEMYTGQAEGDKDCVGREFSATPWSNPVELSQNSTGVDCMRLCYVTETCFAAVISNHKCFLKNDKCFSNLKSSPGTLLGVMSVVREDYHCGCRYPFIRKRASGALLSWIPTCPESQLDRNPYRCCSERGLCVRCRNGESPPPIERGLYKSEDFSIHIL